MKEISRSERPASPTDALVSDASASRPNTIGRSLEALRNYTSSRVALRRAGNSIATADILDFQLAHAEARDAVKAELDLGTFTRKVREDLAWLERFQISVIGLKSAAGDRNTFVRRPDLGRSLDRQVSSLLQYSPCDVVFIIADGLSAIAPERNAIPLLSAVLPNLLEGGAWTAGPLCVVKNARVAIGDQIGALIGASLSVMLIGERPGLSSPDSLGVYITWNPKPGRTEAERNCISNIRGGGLSTADAARRLLWYLREARTRKLTGTALKESTDDLLNNGKPLASEIG